jgi:hypothetical protein
MKASKLRGVVRGLTGEPAKVGPWVGAAMQERHGGRLLPMRKGGCGGREAPERKRTLDVAAG